VASGLVASLAQPGGNVTGLSSEIADAVGKRLELLREVVPSLRRVAILANVGNPLSVMELGDTQAAARTLNLEFDTLKFGEQKMSRTPSRRSRAVRKHFMFVATGYLKPIRSGSTSWRLARDYRRCIRIGSTSKREV
jgi:hypothetical protein